MDFFHFKIYSWALLSIACRSPGSHTHWEGHTAQFSHKHRLDSSPWLQRLSFSIHPERAARAVFLKYCFPSHPCPESMMFPRVYSETSLPEFQSSPLSSSIISIQVLNMYYCYKPWIWTLTCRKVNFVFSSWEISPPVLSLGFGSWTSDEYFYLGKCPYRLWLALALCREGVNIEKLWLC